MRHTNLVMKATARRRRSASALAARASAEPGARCAGAGGFLELSDEIRHRLLPLLRGFSTPRVRLSFRWARGSCAILFEEHP